MRRFPRLDATHRAAADALRAAGWSVVSLAAVGGGVPDLLIAKGGFTALLEMKSRRTDVRESAASSRKRLNAMQEDFRMAWRGAVLVEWDAEGAVMAAELRLARVPVK